MPSPHDDLNVFERVYRRMLDALPTAGVESEEGIVYPLKTLNRGADHDFTLVLLRGWAAIAQIAAFYRDRIVEEGYLRTARESRSIEFLGRLLGYRGWRGSAAHTWLALTVSSTRLPQDSARPSTVSIPPGGNLVVQNIPPQGSMPVVFESHDAVECRVEWNSLVPWTQQTASTPGVFDGMIGMRLAGAVTSVSPGRPVLIETAESQYFRLIETVEVHRAEGFTVVTWDEPLAVAGDTDAILSVRTLRQQAGMLGRRAQSWPSAPDALRALTGTRSGGVMTLAPDWAGAPAQEAEGLRSWSSIQTDLPPGAVRALAVSAKRIFAATSGGLYATAVTGAPAWTLLKTTPAHQDVQSLFIDDRGFLYAGATRGAVSLSTDDGQTWQALRGPMVNPAPGTGSNDGQTQPAENRTPWWRRVLIFLRILRPDPPPQPAETSADATPPDFDGVVHALCAGSAAKQRWIFAGTDRGVFRMQEGGLAWEIFNSANLPGYNSDTALCGTAVNALCLASDLLFAGTAEGLWSSTPGAKTASWESVKLGSEPAQPAVFALTMLNGKYFAGTAVGLFTSSDGKTWTSAGNFPRGTAVLALAAREVAGFTPGPVIAKLCVLAGTANGVYASSDAGSSWALLAQQELPLFVVDNRFSKQLQQKTIPDLLRRLFDANGEPLPGDAVVTVVTDHSVWRISGYVLRRNGKLIAVSRVQTLSGLDLRAVALGSDGRGWLASATGAFLEQEWPGFQVSGNSVALDRSLGELPLGSTVVFHQEAPAAVDLIAEVNAVEQRSVQAWGAQGTVTVLSLALADAFEISDGRPVGHCCATLGLFRQRDASVWCKPAPLAPFLPDESPFEALTGDCVDVEGLIDSLRGGLPVAASGLSPAAVVPSAGGVVQITFHTGTGEAAANAFGLEEENLVALIAGGSSLWAAIDGVGVWRRPANRPAPGMQERWHPVGGPSAPAAPHCLAWTLDGLWVGDNAGVVQWAGDQKGWMPDPGAPGAVQVIVADAAGNLFAADDAGQIFRRDRASGAWMQLSPAVQLSGIRALVFDDKGDLYIGALEGVFRLSRPATTQGGVAVAVPPQAPGPDFAAMREDDPDPPDGSNVTALAFSQGSLFAGTATGGLIRLSRDGSQWQQLPGNRLRSPIQALAFAASGDLLVATGGEGVWQLSPASGSWHALFPSASNDIVALVVTDEQALLAAARNGTVLFTDHGRRKTAIRSALFTASPAYAGMLDLETVPADLSTLFEQCGVTLNRPEVLALRRGKLWMVRSGAAAWILYLRDPGLATAALCVVQAKIFAACRMEREDAGTPALDHWALRDGADTWKLAVPKGAVLLGPSTAGSTQHAEVTTLRDVELNSEGGITRLSFAEKLKNLYDPSATTLTANLAWATHGATVALEVLGDGNAALPGQSFALRQPPVTRAEKRPETGLTTALAVRVHSNSSPGLPPPTPVNPMPVRPPSSGDAWKEVETFFGAGPRDRVYTLQSDVQGTETIRFGDGMQGARLPTGSGNVTATYRSGLGAQGNLPAGSLIVFRKRPVGIRSVTNPVPACEGIDAETIEDSRARMNLSLRALDRIVSRQDYVDFCLGRADVIRAHLTSLQRSQKPLFFLSIVPVGDPPAQPSVAQLHHLREAIARARADRTPVETGGFERRLFRLGGTLIVEPDCDAEAVTEAVRAALIERFSIRHRDLAEDVTSAEVIAVIQAVPLVRGVDLTAFYPAGARPELRQTLHAKPARWDRAGKNILPAELLVYDATDGDLMLPVGIPA